MPRTQSRLRVPSRIFEIGKVQETSYPLPTHVTDVANYREYIDGDAKINLSGRRAVDCPLDLIWYRAILTGVKFNCSLDVLDIAVLCGTQTPIFLRPSGYHQVADLLKTQFEHPLSDHLTYLNAFNAYMRVQQILQERFSVGSERILADWCMENGLNIRALEEACKARDRVSIFLKERKVEASRASVMDMTSIRNALAVAFCTHTAIHYRGDVYRTVHENTSALLSPVSSLVGRNHEWIMYTTLYKSGGKQQFQVATAIDAEWLVDLPFFQEAIMPRKATGEFRQSTVKSSLDDAKARMEARNEH